LAHEGFNPRPCARGDAAYRRSKSLLCGPFQSAPLREGRRTASRSWSPSRTSFNPRPCARGDSCSGSRAALSSSSFNPRPCARGDWEASLCRYFRSKFQSAPLREGRPLERDPTTNLRSGFQSAPLREGRQAVIAALTTGQMFQSAPLREGRHEAAPPGLPSMLVSIRAPARGATLRRSRVA